MLSDRLRRDRDAGKEDGVKSESADVLSPDYLPPCYWGINAFGPDAQSIRHRHPFADLKASHTVDEELPPYSVFTWPFRISFNFDDETKKRHGKYHRDFEQRINQFFAAHQVRQSVVFLYLNYDNPISGDAQQYAVVGCGLLDEKGKTTRFPFDEKTLKGFQAHPGMQNFPVTNWSRRLSLDPDTVVRLPYQEYVQHVRRNPDEEAKLDEISVLVDDEALLPSFKYVCDSMDDDQCLVMLYRLRRAFDRVGAHGIAAGDVDESLARIDRLIEQVWKARGSYPGAAGAISLLSRLGGSDSASEERPQTLVEKLQDSLGTDEDLAARIEELLSGNDRIPDDLKEFKGLIRDAREGVQVDPVLLSRSLDLSVFSLSGFQMERILGVSGNTSECPAFDRGPLSADQIAANPYLLAERYQPIADFPDERLKEMENPLRRDAPIGLFHIDAGLFPDRRYLQQSDRHSLSRLGPERMRALLIRELTSSATQHSDCFIPLGQVVGAIRDYPLFYLETLEFRPDILLSSKFLTHFAERVIHVSNSSGDYFYLKEVRDAEKTVEDTVRQLISRKDHEVDDGWVNAWIEEGRVSIGEKVRDFKADAFTAERREAAGALLRRSIVILSGRPGSGKTQVIGELVRQLRESREPVTLLAPTGKAVLRLQESAGGDVRTIDRLLWDGWLGEGGIAGVETVPDRSLEKLGDIRNLIIDESSMLDLPKLATLFRVLNAQGLDKVRRVILVGDINQLPPIGLGRPFEDLLSWVDQDSKRKSKHHVHLEVNCRQRDDSVVLEAAELFVSRNRYHSELLEAMERGGQVSKSLRVVLWQDGADLVQKLDEELGGVIERAVGKSRESRHHGLNQLFGLGQDGEAPKDRKSMRMDRWQILTPYHRRYEHAAEEINEQIRKVYKDNWWPVVSGFSPGDKVIRLTNKYEYNGRARNLVLSNGSIGVVNFLGTPAKARALFAIERSGFSISGKESEVEAYDLAYAITVHKAQGSDFEDVFVVLPTHYPLLTRELVYTALTRSQRSVTIFLQQGETSPFQIARRRSAVLYRNSSIFSVALDKKRLLEPEEGHRVDSKIEYILYTALMKARDEGKLVFRHHEEVDLAIPDGTQKVHPDFTIEVDGRRWYLEHLGMLDAKRYSEDWQRKRRTYRQAGLEEQIITTDDLNGVGAGKVEQVIQDICAGNLRSTPSNGFSLHHYCLWE